MPPPQSIKAGAGWPTERAHGPTKGVQVIGLPTGDPLVGQACYVMGWSLRNTSQTTTAAFSIYDGLDASGEKRFPVNLWWGESSREWYGPDGVFMDIGVFYVAESGGIEGSVLVAFPEVSP